jgi:N-acetyl-gamma-glutamyl-phosphate reductase
MYSHARHVGGRHGLGSRAQVAPSEEPVAPVSATSPSPAAAAVDRRQLAARGELIRVAVVGATGYAGGELLRLLARHPFVRLTAAVARRHQGEPLAAVHPHLAGVELSVSDAPGEADAVFFALPHGASAGLASEIAAAGTAVIDLGADFRLRDPADYRRWYHLDHPAPHLLPHAVYGLPELHRAELHALATAVPAIVASPGCYPTAALLALVPLVRAGLVADVAVDAKSGISGAGREPRGDLHFAEANENVRPYGLGGHRHVAEIEQELRLVAGTDALPFGAVDFLPHLVPMTRGILATCHVRPTRPTSQAELDDLYAAAYRHEPFVRVVAGPPATKEVLGSNEARVAVHWDERTGRILAFAVIDNLVKGAAGQAVQAFNLVFGLPETAGLEALPLAP